MGGRAPASATKLALAHIAACHGDRALPRGGAEDKLDIAMSASAAATAATSVPLA